MDLIIEILLGGIPLFILSIIIVFVIKCMSISKMKTFDLAEIFFSFFRIYDADQIRMSSNKKRINFMRFNNLLNYYTYVILAVIIIVYFITKNTN